MFACVFDLVFGQLLLVAMETTFQLHFLIIYL